MIPAQLMAVITGIADKDVIIVIDGDSGRETVEEAPLEKVQALDLDRPEITALIEEYTAS